MRMQKIKVRWNDTNLELLVNLPFDPRAGDNLVISATEMPDHWIEVTKKPDNAEGLLLYVRQVYHIVHNMECTTSVFCTPHGWVYDIGEYM